MLFKILKRDLTRRKGVNIILFIFITLASVFLSSSVNNILAVSSGLDYFMKYSNVPDLTVVTNGNEEKGRIDSWLNQSELVEEYDFNYLITLSSKNVDVVTANKRRALNSEGDTLYIGTQDVDYNKVFDEKGRSFTLEDGEMAVSNNFVELNGLKLGDHIEIDVKGIKREFVVAKIMKDAAFGNKMASMMRMMVNEKEYNTFFEECDKYGIYYIDSADNKGLLKEIARQDYATVMNMVERSTYQMVYAFDMIMAGLLILIGVCLILIAMLVLRFTLVFTLEEDYPEIGIMKAVGLRGFAIKKIYLAKYFTLVTVGAVLGLILSVPVSRLMVKSVSNNILLKDSANNIGSNIVCTVAIIFFVMLFCYHCTKKLNKVSPITAIRGGGTGERFSAKRGIRLFKRKRLPIPLLLGINDITSHLKRYIVLVATFCISFILITIPLNTLNTMKSDEMAEKFLLNKDSEVLIRQIEGKAEEKFANSNELKDGMKRIKSELKELGYEASLTAVPFFFFNYGESGSADKRNLLTIQLIGADTELAGYEEGKAPELENEIAFSSAVLEEAGWEIGDSIRATMGGEEKVFIITGSYSDYMQLGKGARLNPTIDCGEEIMFEYWCVMVDMDTDKTQDGIVSELKGELPDYEWMSTQELVDQNVGGIQQMLDKLLIPMTALLCAVIMLITVLMERLFIAREKGEIAMMKSMGFRNSVIRNWQVLRMVGVVIVSMIFAIPLSLVSNQWLLKPIFAIMGAEVKIQVVPWLVYGVYPGILLVGIIAATIFATKTIRIIDIREINNLE